MLFQDAILEFGFDCKVRKLSPKSINNYQKQLRYQEYCEKRWAYLNGSGFDGADKETRKNTWGSMVYNLMPDYGVYYFCPSSILNALGDQAEEISRLVAQVMAERQEDQN